MHRFGLALTFGLMLLLSADARAQSQCVNGQMRYCGTASGCSEVARQYCNNGTWGPCTVVPTSTWSGANLSWNLHDYGYVHCGGPNGTCPHDPTGKHGAYPTSQTPIVFFMWNGCPSPSTDMFGCRFTTGWTGNSTSDVPATRYVVETGDALLSSAGDVRNEVVYSKEACGAKQYYTEGDDRYYSWETWFNPEAGGPYAFSDPVYDYNTAKAWQVFFQFHEVGDCASNGVPLTIGVNRTDVTPGDHKGNKYQLTMFLKSEYDNSASQRVWPAPNVLGNVPIVRQRWYRFTLHVKWSTDPNVGKVELWVDGQKVYSAPRKTLYKWPAPSATCTESFNGDRTEGTAMPVYLKTGIYRDGKIPAYYPSTVFHRGLEAATTCLSVWPYGCP